MRIELTPALEQDLQEIAEEKGQDPHELAIKVLERFVSNANSLAEDIQDAETEAELDGWLSHDEVFANLNRRLLKTA